MSDQSARQYTGRAGNAAVGGFSHMAMAAAALPESVSRFSRFSGQLAAQKRPGNAPRGLSPWPY
jgi:hypothetical protein